MSIIHLTCLWKAKILPEAESERLQKLGKKIISSLDDQTSQTTFFFSKPPRIKFIPDGDHYDRQIELDFVL